MRAVVVALLAHFAGVEGVGDKSHKLPAERLGHEFLDVHTLLDSHAARRFFLLTIAWPVIISDKS